MAQIEYIPEDYLEGIIKLLYAKIDDIRILKKALDNLTEYSYPHIIAEQISKEITFLKKNEIKEIIEAVGSLTSLLDDPQELVTIDDIIDNLSNIVEHEDIKGIDRKIINIKEFKEKLRLLLETDSIIYSFKSSDLLTTNKNSIIFAKIISDIRPVFGENVEDSPKAAVIVHNLNIHYSVGVHKRHEDFFVTLDSNDIKYLKEVINRAEKKDKSLKTVLKDTRVRLFNTKEREK